MINLNQFHYTVVKKALLKMIKKRFPQKMANKIEFSKPAIFSRVFHGLVKVGAESSNELVHDTEYRQETDRVAMITTPAVVYTTSAKNKNNCPYINSYTR